MLLQDYQDALDELLVQYPGLYPGQNGGHSSIAETSQVRVSRHLDASTTTHVAKIMVPTLKVQLFLLNEIYMVTHLPDCGKDNSKKFHWIMDERKYQTGNALCIDR